MIPSTVSTGGSCSSSSSRIITTTTTTSDSSFRNHKATVSSLVYHRCVMVRYQFRIILCVTIIYIIITMTRTIPTTTFLNHHHDTSSSILADCSGMMGHNIQSNNNNNNNQNHFSSRNSESTNRGIDWSLYPYEVDGVTVLQMQHMLHHLSSSSSSSGNILIWMGTQFTSQMMSENDPHNHSFQQMILFWNSVANYYNNGSIIVLLIEMNDDNDHDYFSTRSSTLRTKITTTQAYYNAMHKRYPQLYFYTIKYTTKSKNVHKQFRYYTSSASHYNNNNNHNAVWEEQLDITTILPSIVYTTSFDMIWINRPGKKENIGVHRNSNNDPVAGPFQAIYMTQQIIHHSFHLRSRHDNTNIMNHNDNTDSNIAVAEVQPLHHPIYVFVAMDANTIIMNHTNDNELKHLSTSTTSRNNNHNINIEKKFSNLIFDRRPIRIIPSTWKYNTTTSTTISDIDNGLNLNASLQFYTYDMAQYIFYDHDPYMIIPGRSDDD